MADPRVEPPQSRRSNLSELMQAQARANAGEKVNACPFGCDVSELDDNGYCRHLVGFTDDGKTMEPMVERDGRRRVCGRAPQPVLRGDRLVPITVSSRVYRDVDSAEQPKQEKAPAGAGARK